jgi:hypothetical protein
MFGAFASVLLSFRRYIPAHSPVVFTGSPITNGSSATWGPSNTQCPGLNAYHSTLPCIGTAGGSWECPDVRRSLRLKFDMLLMAATAAVRVEFEIGEIVESTAVKAGVYSAGMRT